MAAAVCPGAPFLITDPAPAPSLARRVPNLLAACRTAVPALAPADRLLVIAACREGARARRLTAGSCAGVRARRLGIRAQRPRPSGVDTPRRARHPAGRPCGAGHRGRPRPAGPGGSRRADLGVGARRAAPCGAGAASAAPSTPGVDTGVDGHRGRRPRSASTRPRTARAGACSSRPTGRPATATTRPAAATRVRQHSTVRWLRRWLPATRRVSNARSRIRICPPASCSRGAPRCGCSRAGPRRAARRATLHYAGAPFGVGYLVASWCVVGVVRAGAAETSASAAW